MFMLAVVENTIEQNHSTDRLTGGAGDDHLIHHRHHSVQDNASVGLAGYAGDDILEGSVAHTGQIHMFAATGNDWLVLDVTKSENAIGTQSHHAYGGPGRDTFQIANIEQNHSPIIGRIDDFDPTLDRILIEGTEIDLTDLPKTITLPGGKVVPVRVIEVEHPEFDAEDLGTQHFLAIGDDIFYALEGARDLQNGTSKLTGEERHFLQKSALKTLRAAETEDYDNPKNFVPLDHYEHREDELNLNYNQSGADISADTGESKAAHMYGNKNNPDAPSSDGEQVMRGSDGSDVIDGNSGNDTIFGGLGDDLIAGGIDNDVLNGDRGADMIWGGDGNDTIFGGRGNDYFHGGRGDDVLSGGTGSDTLNGGEGNDILTGGGGEDAINRFHFYEFGGEDVITDFKVGTDLITLQDDIDPLTVELYENEDGNTVLNYGEDGSVELLGVSLKSFQDTAEIRAEEDNSIISISTDPEEEMLRELRVETGYYGDAEPPDLMVDGILYGDAAFTGSEPGGYTYVITETKGEESSSEDHRHDLTSEEVMPQPNNVIPVHEREEQEEPPQDEEEDDVPVGTCFVATAAYRDPDHPDVVFLRAFRDEWLVYRAWGRVFIKVYWQIGPILARPVRRNPRLGRQSKTMISGIVRVLQKVWVRQEAWTGDLASPTS
jgi:hypothetical protein